MFKRIAATAVVFGALLTVAPTGAFARDRDDQRGRAVYEQRGRDRDRRVHVEYRHNRWDRRDCR